MEKEEVRSFIVNYLTEHLDPARWVVIEAEDHIHVKYLPKEETGVSISLAAVASKLQEGREAQQVLDTAERALELALAKVREKRLEGQTDRIFPVLRSASHPTTKQGIELLHRKHTAESMIFYALDLGKTYVLIDDQLTCEAGLTAEDIDRLALLNLKKLDTSYKTDEVAGNRFYFFAQKDGYAASRVLNDELLAFMRRKVKGEMGVAIPHQDVLIIADMDNETGYQVLAKLNMDFCVKGDIPISPLPFILNEDHTLEPIMVISNPGAAPRMVRKKGEE